MTARPALEPGLQLAGRYHLCAPLGRGGAGTVWRADDDLLDRPVAVKLLHPELERDDSAVVRFRREATSAAVLTHPNAVIVYDIGEDSGRIFLVMELVDGPTLSDLLALGPIAPAEVAAIGGAVSRALGAAHDRDLVHRDVKPGNVLLTREGVAKMADFGIATALGDAQARLTTPGMVVGTSTYLAPEQLSGDAVDGRADIYSLGLVLFECLTGEPAFSGGTAVEVATRRLAGDVPPPSSRIAGIPEELDLIVQRATRRDPAERWAHGADLAAALLALAPEDAMHRLADLIERRVGPVAAPAAPADDTVVQPGAGSPDPADVAVPARGAAPGTAPPDAATTALPGHRDPASAPDATREAADAHRTDEQPAARHGPPSPATPGGAPADGGVAHAAGARATPRSATGTLPVDADPAAHAPAPEGPTVGAGRGDGRPGWRPALLGLVVLTLAVFAVLGVLGGDDVLDSTPDGSTDGEADGGDMVAHAIADDGAYDPFGSSPEHPEDVPNVYDGDPDTTWQTQRYNSAAFGNLKPGVGLFVDLGEAVTVREVELAIAPAGADLELYAGDDAPTGGAPGDWGRQVATISAAETSTVIELDEAVESRVWLVWFTSLPADGGGHRVSVSELELRG